MPKNFTHAVMFHHFNNDVHPKGQGSVSSDTFREIICWLDNKYNILSPDKYFSKAIRNKLDNKDICLTFDDALKCQYDIALPILEENNLKAFFFVMSSPLKGQPNYLEIFRYFRCVFYKDLNNFYTDFFEQVKETNPKIYLKNFNMFSNIDYLNEFPFYSFEDRWFRFLRDLVLKEKRYNKMMLTLMSKKGFNFKDILSKLSMSEKNLISLDKKGHVIGLHSYNHPTKIESLPIEIQHQEYYKNKNHLETILGEKKIYCMAHPCGSYNKETLSLLRKLGIKLGFRSNTKIKNIVSLLEIPREDHSNILKRIYP